MLETNRDWNAYNLGRTAAGGITPSGISPQQVEAIEMSHKKNTAGVVAQRDALLKALLELDPNHPLAKREARLEIYDQGYDAYKEKK